MSEELDKEIAEASILGKLEAFTYFNALIVASPDEKRRLKAELDETKRKMLASSRSDDAKIAWANSFTWQLRLLDKAITGEEEP